jgi:hypothetical protein
MEKKYGALRIIATLNTIIGWAILILGSIAAIGVIISSSFIFGFPILMASLFIGLILIAAGEIIYVIIDIEENTRQVSNKSSPKIEIGNFVNEKKSANVEIVKSTSTPLTNSEKLTAESSLEKLLLNGYICEGFDSNEKKWKLRSTTNSADFEVNYKQLVDLANNF